MNKKSLIALVLITALNCVAPKQIYGNPGAQSEIEKETNQKLSLENFFPNGYQQQDTLPELVRYNFNNWAPITNYVCEKGIRITSKTNVFQWWGIFGLENTIKLWDYDKKGLENLKELGYVRTAYCCDRGIFTQDLKRINPEKMQHKFIRVQISLEDYSLIENEFISTIQSHLENPFLEYAQKENQEYYQILFSNTSFPFPD